MTGLDYFAFLVMAVLLGAGIYIAVLLGGLPGRIAAQRAHPQADAIQVAGWFGLLTLGLLWPVALIWAYTRSGQSAPSGRDDSLAALAERVTRLEATDQGHAAADTRAEEPRT